MVARTDRPRRPRLVGLAVARAAGWGGGDLDRDTDLARNKDGRLEIFVVRESTQDGQTTIWHAWQDPDGEWSTWISLKRPGSGANPDGIAVAANSAGRLELFVTETNQHAIWHRWQDPAAPGGWSPWTSLGAPTMEILPSAPVLARMGDGHVLLFTVATNKTVWFHRKSATAASDWTHWEPVVGIGTWYERAGVGINVGAEAAGRLLVVATSQENRLWHTQQQSASDFRFEGWESFGSSTYDRPWALLSPTLAANADGRLELLLLSIGGDIYQYTQTGTSEAVPSLPIWSEARVWPDPGQAAATAPPAREAPTVAGS